MHEIPPGRGTGLVLKKNQVLEIRSPGEQVSDFFCSNLQDVSECLSMPISLDEAQTLHLTEGHVLFSNLRNPMVEISQDTLGKHDGLIPPCSLGENGHDGCFENLKEALAPFGLNSRLIQGTLNAFMSVEVDAHGKIHILPSKARNGDYLRLKARMDLIVGLTACAHLRTNGGTLKPIEWTLHGP